MSTSESVIVAKPEYLFYGYIRHSTICYPEALMKIILLHCYLFELISQVIISFSDDNNEEEDIGKFLHRLRYYLQNHQTYNEPENHHHHHLWSSLLSLI